MFSSDDTIVAIATPPGRGAIGIVRLSGPAARDTAAAILEGGERLAPWRAHLTRVVDTAGAGGGKPQGAAIDQVIAIYFPAPRSYTGEEVVEISAHGSPVVLQQILRAALGAGARLAQPGEFTLRAFLNGRIDLVQAEAVADLIEAVTPTQAQAAFDQLEGTLTRTIHEMDTALFDLIARLEASLDFPEEGYHFIDTPAVMAAVEAVAARMESLMATAHRGRLIREGCQVAILGRPNVGKSSLFNYLVGVDRAIVTPVAGTTRDLVTEVADLQGIAVTLIDTAGIRDGAEPVEAEGVKRAREALEVADLRILMLDRSAPLGSIDLALLCETEGRSRVVIANKADLPAAWHIEDLAATGSPTLALSLKTFEGADRLPAVLSHALGGGDREKDPVRVTNVRHQVLLGRAHTALVRARDAAAQVLSEEFVLVDLQEARTLLEEITGRRAPDAVLGHIFERFCIGK